MKFEPSEIDKKIIRKITKNHVNSNKSQQNDTNKVSLERSGQDLSFFIKFEIVTYDFWKIIVKKLYKISLILVYPNQFSFLKVLLFLQIFIWIFLKLDKSNGDITGFKNGILEML